MLRKDWGYFVFEINGVIPEITGIIETLRAVSAAPVFDGIRTLPDVHIGRGRPLRKETAADDLSHPAPHATRSIRFDTLVVHRARRIRFAHACLLYTSDAADE